MSGQGVINSQLLTRCQNLLQRKLVNRFCLEDVQRHAMLCKDFLRVHRSAILPLRMMEKFLPLCNSKKTCVSLLILKYASSLAILYLLWSLFLTDNIFWICLNLHKMVFKIITHNRKKLVCLHFSCLRVLLLQPVLTLVSWASSNWHFHHRERVLHFHLSAIASYWQRDLWRLQLHHSWLRLLVLRLLPKM